jgi:hypothetical protein
MLKDAIEKKPIKKRPKKMTRVSQSNSRPGS